MFRFGNVLRNYIQAEVTEDIVGGRLGVDLFPLVAWSLGGTVTDNKTGQLIKTVPAKYGLGCIKYEQLTRYPFRCPDNQFGFIVCLPRSENWKEGGEFEMDGEDIIYRL